MSYFDLDPAGAESARQQAILNPIQPGDMGPGFWSGSLKGLGQGLLQSGAQAALVASDTGTAALMPTARKIDEFFGGATVQDFLRSEQQKTTDAVFKLMPGPEIGKVGQLAYGLATVIPQAVGGTLAGGPGGGAAAVATIQGYAGKIELERKGVDPATATTGGIIQGVAAGAGVLMPAAFGTTLATRIGTGAASNALMGVAQRGATSALLSSRGYNTIAEQYKAFDTAEVITDAVLGAAFGGIHHATARGEAAQIPPSLADEALAASKQQHLEISTAPGIPADPQSRSLHGAAMDKAVADLVAGRPVDVSQTGVENAVFVPNRAVLEAQITKALREEGSLRTALDEVDALRAEVESRGLTPADEAEFAGRRLQDAADAMEATGARDLPGQIVGRDGEVFVGDSRQPVRFMLVEADALAATIGKAANQFRDRTRVASQLQIARMANDLQFARLGEAPSMAEGAPTLATTGEIIGGNGRVAAIQQAYTQGSGDAYRVALLQRASEFGLTQDQVAGMNKPVLVRQLTESVDVKLAAILSNESQGLRMSSLEQAHVDAERMPDLPEMPASGNLSSPALDSFRKQWLEQYPQSELGEFVTADGRLSPQGEMRMRNAILAKAYGDSPTLAHMLEATDDLSRNLSNAMVKAAPEVAQTRGAIERGELHDLDIQPQLLQAYDTLSRLRNEGVKLEDWISQTDMFGTGVGPEAVAWMQHFQGNARSAKAMAEAITGYYGKVKALGDPRQAGMFDALPPSRGELLRATLDGKSVEPPAKTVVSEPQSDTHVGQTFTSDTKARAYIAKNSIGATHTVKKLKGGEFEIRRRPGAATMEAAADKIAKQEEAVRQAAENIASRKGLDASVEQVLFDQPNAHVATEDGNAAPAGVELERADADIARAEEEAPGYNAAAACAARMGT